VPCLQAKYGVDVPAGPCHGPPFPNNGKWSPIRNILPSFPRLFTRKTMSSSDVEMIDSGDSDSEPEGLQRVRVAADAAAACKRRLEGVSVKDKQ
jgi:hypothetical protein